MMLNEIPEENNTLLQGYESAADLLRLLAHPARLAILEILREGEACVCHIESILGLRQAYVSQQLMVLRQGGVVSMRRQGWNVFYRVNDARIFEVVDALYQIRAPARAVSMIPAVAPRCTCPRCRVGAATSK